MEEDGMEKSGSDRAKYLIGFVVLLAVVLIGISAYFGANGAKGTMKGADSALAGTTLANAPALNRTAGLAQTQQNNSSAIAGEAQPPAVQPNAPSAAPKEVTIDFLYADWCGHCQTMKPIVAKYESLHPKDRFEVRYWNEAKRSSNTTVSGTYATYTGKGYFTGFPTFVANGNDPMVGSMPDETFRSWVCGKFSSPKPEVC